MTILVTGATGRVGSRFVPRLLRHGGKVRVLIRNISAAIPLTAVGAETVVGDVTDPAAVERALKGVQGVVHLAAVFRPGDEIVPINHNATVELARAAGRAGVGRFVYTSTNQVYGPGHGRPALETDEPRPDRPYSITKADAEQSLLELHETEGLPVRVFRLPVIYGDGDPHLADMVKWVLKWPAHRRLHLVHHADVAQALLRGLWADGADGEIFNIADDAPVTAHELLTIHNTAPEDDAAARPLDDPWDSMIDTSKARRRLGLRPIYPTIYSAMDAGAF